jgi:hypothetical protein
MMLFDTIAGMDLSDMPEPYKAETEAFKRAVSAAQRFVLDPSMARAADALTRPEVTRAVPWCKAPYENTWLEVTHMDRPTFAAAVLREGLIRPVRVGVLIEPARDLGEGLYDFTLAWDCPKKDRGTSSLPVRLGFDMRKASPISVSPIGAIVDLGNGDRNWVEARDMPWHLAIPGNENMGQELPFAFSPMRHYSRRSVETIAKHDKQRAIDILEMSKNDWAGEPWFWMATLALLNAKGGAEVHPGEDRTRLNAARAKAGKPSLKPFHVLKIDVGARAAPHASSAPSPREHPRAHMVRGHFKHCKHGGLRWWRPFVRGDLAKGFADKSYEVTKH